jgi:hypothetical protein
MRDPLRRRDPELVRAILDAVYVDNTDSDPEPTPWNDLVEAFTSPAHHWRTVENVLYELVAVGALHRVGKPSARGRPDTRALLPTLLGRAWLAGELHPTPTTDRTMT